MTPTIIIGVGGLGSNIVDAIKGKMPNKEDRKDVAFLVLDTDINWMEKLKHVESTEQLQTSISQTVGVYLSTLKMQGDYEFDLWFDSTSKEILSKDVVNGAGQIRQVSKLAFDGSMKSGNINKITSSLHKLTLQDTSGKIKGVRVVIVGSLAGGTGSGIFQQVAFLTRSILNENGVSTVLVLGFFMLGGVLEGCGSITKMKEKNNIFANTYASFKELSSFTLATSSKGGSKNIPSLKNLDFQFHPTKKIENISDLTQPFDYYHIYDHKNVAGKNLSELDEYKDVITNTIFAYIFSPISDGAFSKLDNQIIEIINSNGLSRVKGSGAGRLFYPFEDIVRLFALKRTNLSLSDTWLKFDRQFEDELRSISEKRSLGDYTTALPSMGPRYLYYLEEENNKESKNPIFVNAKRQIEVRDDKGQLIHRKSVPFIAEIENFIKEKFEDELLKSYEKKMVPDYEKLMDKDEMSQEVTNRVNARDSFVSELQKIILDNQGLVRNIILDDGNKNLINIGKNYNENEYCFNYWILKNEVIHPIAVRAFIYECILRLEDDILTLTKEELTTLQFIENFSKYFKNATGEKIISPQQAATDSNKGGILGRLKGKKARLEFAEHFSEFIDKTSSVYKKYGIIAVTLKIKKDLLNKLKLMADTSERYFTSISTIVDQNEKEIKILEKKYEYENGYDRVVLGSPDLLGKLWQKHKTKLSSVEELPEDTSLAIYDDWYQKLLLKSKDENFVIRWDEKYVKAIKEDLLKSNVNFILNEGTFDLNIINAIFLEAELNSVSDKEAYMKSKLLQLQNLVVEFGPDIIIADSSRYAMWGISPNAFDLLPKSILAELKNADSLRDGNDFIVDSAFDKRELIRSVILMGQQLKNFTSFMSENDGKYYSAYKKRINDVNAKDISSISPHLDKRWHMPKYLPEIEPSQTEKILNGLAKKMVYGIMSQKIKLLKARGLYVWTYNNLPLIDFSGNLISSTTIDDLWDGLQENMYIIDEIKKNHKKELKSNLDLYGDDIKSYTFVSDAKKVNYLQSGAFKNDQNILELILNYAITSASDMELCMRLLTAFNTILDDCFDAAYSNLDGSKRRDDRRKFVANNFIRGIDVLKNPKFDTEAEYLELKQILTEH
jgi:arsenate reductase-like glutaredoxin family protein